MANELRDFTRDGLSGTAQAVNVAAYYVRVFATKLNIPGQLGSADHPVTLAGERYGSGPLSLDFTSLNPGPDQPVLIFGVVYRSSPSFFLTHMTTSCGPLPDPFATMHPSIIPRRKPDR